ncbi:DUF1178 family protein [Uliginosibacterium sp. H1]|uniref:DUF1178 family protein n=1 Tax=Uliginosibacterium sp. H1 TaxID=3114757 RepID=UPI002E192E52|nr:DUF1178 family protein [Uliginosibacterium sp. H1]
MDLCCAREHRFEGWFASAEQFEQQCASGQVACPSCSNQEIRRLPSAPSLVQRGSPQRASASDSQPDASHGLLTQLIETLKKQAEHAEDVGARFPEEARRIHHGDAEDRSIRGTASAQDMRELLEEGVSVLPVPGPKKGLH